MDTFCLTLSSFEQAAASKLVSFSRWLISYIADDFVNPPNLEFLYKGEVDENDMPCGVGMSMVMNGNMPGS